MDVFHGDEGRQKGIAWATTTQLRAARDSTLVLTKDHQQFRWLNFEAAPSAEPSTAGRARGADPAFARLFGPPVGAAPQLLVPSARGRWGIAYGGRPSKCLVSAVKI